jgi:hypothetical protein
MEPIRPWNMKRHRIRPPWWRCDKCEYHQTSNCAWHDELNPGDWCDLFRRALRIRALMETSARAEWLRKQALTLHDAVLWDEVPDAEQNGLCKYCAFKEFCGEGDRCKSV